MHTWREPLISRGLYVPRSLLPSDAQGMLSDIGVDVFDTNTDFTPFRASV